MCPCLERGVLFNTAELKNNNSNFTQHCLPQGELLPGTTLFPQGTDLFCDDPHELCVLCAAPGLF